MPRENARYWFPAKRYGWGWGPPITWEGWAVMAGFAVLLVGGIVVVPLRPPEVGFFAYIVLLIVLLAVVCWWKGEPPKWRWGGE